VGAAALLVLAVLVGTHDVTQRLRALDRVETNVPTADGIPVVPALGETGTRFLAHVRRTVPARARVRLLLPVVGAASGTCGTEFRPPLFRWVTYQLLPRPAYCDGTARYWVYVGVDPATVPPPDGATLDTFAPGYAVARLP
jgi:hypothetical protein